MDPSSDDRESLRAAYAMLFSRHQALAQAVWSIVSMSLAAEAALWVGMLTLSLQRSLTLMFGLGFLMIGETGPLAIRFLELSGMLDRQLLDVYEEHLDIPEELRLRHGERFEDRLIHIQDHLPIRSKAALGRRRINKLYRSSGPWFWTDMFLSKLGQPTMLWTSVIAITGIAGASVAVYLASSIPWITALTAVGLFLVSALPWILAAERGPVARLRSQT